MAKKYIIIRMSRDTYKKFKKRNINLSNAVSKIMGKKKKIPMTKFYDFIANQETVYPQDFAGYIKNQRRRR